jgi:hypothetical protein
MSDNLTKILIACVSLLVITLCVCCVCLICSMTFLFSKDIALALTTGTVTHTPPTTTRTIAATQSALPTIQAQPAETDTPYPTYTAYPTYTQPPEPTVISTLVPPTSSTPLPEITATEPLTLYSVHPPGFYLVNVDIGPGQWRSTGNAENCSYKSLDSKGETLNNHYGMAGVTVYIAPTVYQVQFDPPCGDWVYLSP